MLGADSTLPKSYRKIGLTFLILTIATLLVVFYLTWARVTVIITPSAQNVSQDFIFTVKEGDISFDAKTNIVAGKFLVNTVEGNKSFEATGIKAGASESVGEVTITNNSSKDQALIEKTRLALPADAKTTVIRLKRTVNVPAGGQVTVAVYPENSTDIKNFKIEPTKFIIPGLWQPLQDKIYAQNAATLQWTKGGVTIVSDADLQQAQVSLKDELFQKAKSDINSNLNSDQSAWPKLVSSKIDEIKYDAKAGDETANFNATMKLKIIAIAFNESQVVSVAQEKLKNGLTSGQQLLNLDPKKFTYVVSDYNLDTKEAIIKVTVAGNSVITNNSDLLDKSKLVGLSQDEIKEYFAIMPEVKSVEIKFQPSWLKVSPQSQNRINIEIAR